MNILIPHPWLLDHLETTATPQEIQHYLSLSGPSVERINEVEGEAVYDIEVTTNRVDSMSVRGIAREAAVILTQAGIPSKLKNLTQESATPAVSDTTLPLPTIVNDPKLCGRVLCQVISDVQKVPSPEWMQQRLRQIGVNVHDAVIDITNYITHDLGHPCHAFDYDKIMSLGGTIIVKEALPGKKFVIIDGTEYTTVGGEVVFENDRGEIIDLPAIKGTKNSSIQDDTKNVLFWIEDIDPAKVRFASMKHAIRTVAAQLNEKNVDPHSATEVFNKVVTLLTTLAHGTVASLRVDEFPGEKQPAVIHFHLSDVRRYLGMELPTTQITEILTALGCGVKEKGDQLLITPPTFRPDLNIPADIVEEIARITGYHNLPGILMSGDIPTSQTSDRYDIEHQAKEFLSTLGAQEVYTYSMISEDQANLESQYILSAFVDTNSDILKTHIKLKNPLTDDMVYLRRTLWSQHLEVFQKNPQHKDLAVFEFANTYLPPQTVGELPTEKFHLTLTVNGDVRRAKGMIEGLLRKYYLSPLIYQTTQSPLETKLLVDKQLVGRLLTPPAKNIAVFDIDWKVILSLRQAYPAVRGESKFTPVTEDLTFTIPEHQQIQRVMEAIGDISGVSEIILKDLYKRNATFSLSYASPTKQLTAENATQIRSAIVSAVVKQFDAKLVGEIQG